MSIEFNNLKLFRKQNGFTQEEVAEKLNVSRQAVAKWESGETVPDKAVLLAEQLEIVELNAEEMPRGIRTQPRRRYTCSWGRGQGNGSREAGRSYRGRQKCVRRQTQ